MTGKLQKYANATMYDLTRVIDAADRLYGSIAEFPDGPECWQEHIESLDTALEACPGTTANYHARQRKLEEDRRYECRTTDGPRKQWDGEPDLSREGWEEYQRWERFEYHEERYWRRLRAESKVDAA